MCVRVCVCVCVLREPPLIALAARRHGGNILERHALEKSAAEPNEASWEYGVLIRAEEGAGGTTETAERDREEGRNYSNVKCYQLVIEVCLVPWTELKRDERFCDHPIWTKLLNFGLHH